ncbi:MAG: SulP family inorganic anion transporter [Bacteriovoracaceae bacterium]|nr:SulP family inorganic anion transporter [Bacteriovoracaceae bacterium]
MKINDDLKCDISAGFSVALIALPLSIGIALASGAPASSGIIAAVIGGMIGSWLGGTRLTINGPAAGLIVIVLDAINNIGQGDSVVGFRGMLAAAVVAGVIQVIFGAVKLGRKSAAFPVSVIHGMMAAIGLIIIAKQIHILIGHTPVAKNPVMLFLEIPDAIMDWHPVILLTGLVSLFIMIFWPKIKFDLIKKIPAPLAVVLIASAFSALLFSEGQNLLTIPGDITSWIIFPDFGALSTYVGWKVVISLALVGSLETSLSAAAVDKLSDGRERSDLDKDLISKGVCNILSASIGGLPMIAEIVRSSANVSYGARSWRSNFIHGFCILVMVLILPSALNLIPLSALAAVLIMVGARLGSPAHFRHALHIGKDNAIGFLVTMVVTVAVDLLVGIFVGAIVQYLVGILLGLKVKNTFKADIIENCHGKTLEVFKIRSALIFSNFLTLRENLTKCMEQGLNVELDLTDCEYIDHSVVDQLAELDKIFKSNAKTLEIKYSLYHEKIGIDDKSAIKKQS